MKKNPLTIYLTFFEKHTTRVSFLLSKTILKIAWKRKSTDAGKTAKIPGLTSLARDLCEKNKEEIHWWCLGG